MHLMNFINYICLCSSSFEARTSSPLHFLSNLKNNIVIVKKNRCILSLGFYSLVVSWWSLFMELCIPNTIKESFSDHGQKHLDSWFLGWLPDFGRGDTPAVVDSPTYWNLLTFSSLRSEISDVAWAEARQISAEFPGPCCLKLWY